MTPVIGTTGEELPAREAYRVPDEPLVTIQPSTSGVALNLRDLWSYRELIYFLIWRDVKVRYRQTVFGVAWAVMQPLFTMLIFALFFGRLAGVPSDGIPYPIFAYAGLVPWTFFANAITSGGNSLVGSANLITKVYFPRMIIPLAAVAAGLLDLAIASTVLAVLMVYYGIGVSWNLALFPILVVFTTLIASAVGMWLAALNVKYRDVRFVIPFAVQLWLFVSPVIYPLTFVPGHWRWLLVLNPLTGIIEGYRSSLFDRPFDWMALAVSAALSLTLLVYAAHTFRKMERTFADIV